MIKKHNNKNEYFYSGNNLWVRNFTKPLVNFIDINNLIPEQDMELLLNNEIENCNRNIQQIDTEDFEYPNIVIVSDGYKFASQQKLLETLPQDVVILGVNGALVNWKAQRRFNFYVINNPYPEAMQFLPIKATGWPRCISSTRTYPKFLEKYQGVLYKYSPVPDQYFRGIRLDADYLIDDYRNPICAAIGLAYRFKVKKLLLFCCDEAFEEDRPGAEKLNGLYIYPQQKVAHNLIDGNLYWLKDVKVGDCSSGLNYNNATYIESSDIAKFFGEK